MVETAEAKQVSRAASSLLFPELALGVADNGSYLCCSSCESMFKEEYETLQAAADEA